MTMYTAIYEPSTDVTCHSLSLVVDVMLRLKAAVLLKMFCSMMGVDIAHCICVTCVRFAGDLPGVAGGTHVLLCAFCR